jgi:hypothetical protein
LAISAECDGRVGEVLHGSICRLIDLARVLAGGGGQCSLGLAQRVHRGLGGGLVGDVGERGNCFGRSFPRMAGNPTQRPRALLAEACVQF